MFFNDISKIYKTPQLLKGESLIGKCLGCYTKSQLNEHLKSFEELIQKLNIKTPVVLQTSNAGHVISVAY